MSSSKNKIVLKKLKDTDNVWHSDSTLVFKSSKDKSSKVKSSKV